jgi:hypothetical protein
MFGNSVSYPVTATGLDGTLKPYDRAIDPIVVKRRIGFGLLTTDRSLDQALFAPIHHVTDCLGASQASVTALSIMWRSTLLHSGQVNVRKSWPVLLGSIAESFIGEPQAVHCGPWFCLSSMALPQFGALSSPESHPTAFDVKGSDAMTLIST